MNKIILKEKEKRKEKPIYINSINSYFVNIFLRSMEK